MFLLGHSCWSYLITKTTARQLHTKFPPYLALLSGILPDFDIYFVPLIQHHTYTHSILVLGPISALLTIRYKKTGAILSTGLLSHLLTDMLVGTIPPLYPISQTTIGISNIGLPIPGLPSLTDTILEVGALVLVVAYAYQNKDYLQFIKPNREALPLAITLASIVTLTLLFAGDNNIPLAAFAFSRRALTLISLGHIFLAGALALGTIQGLRAYLTHETNTTNPARKPSPLS